MYAPARYRQWPKFNLLTFNRAPARRPPCDLSALDREEVRFQLDEVSPAYLVNRKGELAQMQDRTALRN